MGAIYTFILARIYATTLEGHLNGFNTLSACQTLGTVLIQIFRSTLDVQET